MKKFPKSYLSDAGRCGLTQNTICLAESLAAGEAGDEKTAWEWLQYATIPAHALKTLKVNLGADFIRKMRLQTDAADALYGDNWLEAR